jgi:Divergent InlB B-repeat domain
MRITSRQRNRAPSKRMVVISPLTLLVVLAGTSTLVAAQTSSPTTPSTVIRACYALSIAYAHILKANQSCAKGETAIQWKKTGPAAPAGPVGPVGAAGRNGHRGNRGNGGNGGNGSSWTDRPEGRSQNPSGRPDLLVQLDRRGGAVASLDGIPCDQGKTTVGLTHSAIDATSRVVTLTCIASNLVTLTVNATGNGAGNITSSPTGITCGPTSGTACSHDFNPGTPVPVAAVPAASSRFAGWSGECSGTGPCVVTVNTATTVTATFVATVTVHISLQEPSTRPVGKCFNPFPFTICNSAGYSGADATFDGGHQPD